MRAHFLCRSNKLLLVQTLLILRHESVEVVDRWAEGLTKAKEAVQTEGRKKETFLGPPKKLLVIVNPFGGRGEAEKIFENSV